MLTQIKFGTLGLRAGRVAVLRKVARWGKPLCEQLRALCNQVGSYYPKRENFRLTPRSKRSSLRSYDPIRAAAKQWIFE